MKTKKITTIMLLLFLTNVISISISVRGQVGVTAAFFVTADENGDVYVFPSKGDGTFTGKQLVGNIGDGCKKGYGKGLGTTTADFDNDGDLDFTIQSCSGTSYLFINNGGEAFTKTAIAEGLILELGRVGDDAATADFNNDVYYDYVVPSSEPFLYLFTNNRDNTFSLSTLSAEWKWSYLVGIDAGDFNEDGNMDFLIVHCSAGEIYLYTGHGDGTFAYKKVFTNWNYGCDTKSLAAGDFNNDGHLDAIVGQDDDGDPGQTWLYIGDGTGQFSYAGEAYDTNPIDEAESHNKPGTGYADAYDFDRDGNLDIVTGAGWAQGPPYIGMLFISGNGDGTFQTPTKIDVHPIQFNPISAPPIPWSPTIPATIDIDPDTLNLKSHGAFLTAYIELPEGYNVEDIDLSTVQLESIPTIADLKYSFVTDPSEYLVDHDGDGILERMVKFDRAAVIDYLKTNDFSDETGKFKEVTLTISGEVAGVSFEGSDTVRVII